MQSKLIAFIIFLLCGTIHAQWSTSQNQNSSGTSAASISTTITITAGKGAITFCKSGSAGFSSFTVTDSCGGNTWTGIGAQSDATVGATELFFLGSATTGCAATVTCNVTPNEGFLGIIAEAGPKFTNSTDASFHNSVATGVDPQTLTTTSYSTTHANEYFFLCAAASISTSFNAGAFGGITAFVDEQNTGEACESATLSSTQTTQTATISASSSSGSRAWSYGGASFQFTPAVATTPYFPQMR